MTKNPNSKNDLIMETPSDMFRSLRFRIWNLPFDFAQGGEFVEPFGIWCLYFWDFAIYLKKKFIST